MWSVEVEVTPETWTHTEDTAGRIGGNWHIG
jgi:hypothetical protein